MSITFHSQWTNEKGDLRAIPHVTTKNTSFLRTCQVLKRMGIKNYAFPLTLYDPDLKDVDVYDLEENNEVNERLRTKVQIEARKNAWYFLRECIRIYEQGGAPIPFRLDRGSCAMAWCFLNGIDYTGMAPRQCGKAQPLYAKLLSSLGWITMGEVRHDTKLIMPDGSLAGVKGIYPQGLKDIYKVTLDDGRSTECCDEHLWRVIHNDPSEPDVLMLKEIKEKFFDVNEEVRIPVCDPTRPDVIDAKLINIEYVGKRLAQCIEVDHDDHLYITDDYIVTHNTVCALSLMAWILYAAGYEFELGMMAKDNKLREENVRRVKTFGENLPSWWLAEDKLKDKKNATQLYYHELRTQYTTFVANPSKSTADLQARGASTPVLHFDEFEYCVNIEVSYSTMLASTETARANAKKNGMPHSNIITTTAGDPTKPECKEAAKILDGAMPFAELMYDIESYEKLHEIVEAASQQKMIIGIFSHLQLGHPNSWLIDKINRSKASRDKVMRDYLNRRVSIQEDPIIPKHTLALINSSQREPLWWQIMADKFVIQWYVPEETVKSAAFKLIPIVVGGDSSEMIGRDATTLVGIDPRSLETVFTFRTSEGNINVVGVMIHQLMLEFPKMIFVPENKSSGTSMIDNVSLLLRKAGHNPFIRIFNWVVNNRHEKEFEKIDIRDVSLLDTAVKRYFGIKTDKTKREELYGSTLLDACKRAASRVRDKILIQELSSLTIRNGRVDHAVGGHDDTVVAWLMAMWFILNGKHLDIYGIKPGTALSFMESAGDNKAKQLEERQALIREKITELERDIKYQTNYSSKRLLQADLNLLRSMVDNGPLPIPSTADDFTRDPRKFTDPVAVENSKTPVDLENMERSMRILLQLA